MSKFKVGDKVVLAPGTSGVEYFYALQGKREYYTITDTASASGYWLQLDGVERILLTEGNTTDGPALA